ncbi:MAG: hypothetical protein U0519_00880 [Candidatus Gracilibacteria bacterium]
MGNSTTRIVDEIHEREANNSIGIVRNDVPGSEKHDCNTHGIRHKIAQRALGVLLTITTLMSPNQSEASDKCKKNSPSCLKKSDDHGDEKKGLEVKGGLAISPSEHGVGIGFETHFSWVPDPKSHDKPHFEWTILDAAVNFYQIPVRSGLPYGNVKSIQGTEFHLSTLGNLVIPTGELVSIGLGGGLGISWFYHPAADIGQSYDFSTYAIKEKTQTVPFIHLHGELNFHVNDTILIYTAYAPHVTLAPVQDEIPGKKHQHIDHTIVAGIGAEF